MDKRNLLVLEMNTWNLIIVEKEIIIVDKIEIGT